MHSCCRGSVCAPHHAAVRAHEEARGITRHTAHMARSHARLKPRRLGIDCLSELEWRHWVPGTEYVKHLVIRNTSTNTVRLKYRQTSTPAFSMDFAEVFKLRPGMSNPLRVGGPWVLHLVPLCSLPPNDGSWLLGLCRDRGYGKPLHLVLAPPHTR